MSNSTRILIGSLAALLAGACSSGGGDGPSGPDDLAAQLAQAGCALQARCGAIGKSELAKCQANAKTQAAMYPKAYSQQEAFANHRLSFSSDAAQKCIAAVSAAGCTADSQNAAFAVCDGVTKGLVATGGACKSSAECANGFCNQGSSGTEGCPGTCAAYVATGMPCDPNNVIPCAPTDYCDANNNCSSQLIMGASCPGFGCGKGLTCRGFVSGNGGPDTPGTCQGLGKLGDECSLDIFGDSDCDPTFWCDDSQMPPKCQAKVAMGAACTSFSQCQDPLDCKNLNQDSSGNIVAGTCAPYLDVGSACDPSNGDSACPWSSTTCDATTKVCTGSGGVGADCSMTSCGTGFYCDGTSMLCAVPVALHGACTPQMTDSNGFPIGDEPCHDGTCDATSNTCTITCM